MKILVCMSVVPDTTTKIMFTPDQKGLLKDGVQFIINPYDELSITKALELTEKNGGSVTVVHVGPSEHEAVIRKALALGVHEAVRIDTEALEAQMAAELIAQYASDKGFDLIMTGRESIDYNSGQMCGLLGALLDVPMVNVISTIEIDNGIARMSRDIDGGKETLTCPLPIVVSAQKDLCEPRIPNMRGIMAARTKPLQVVAAGQKETSTSYVSYESPKAKEAVKLIDANQPEVLIDILRKEAKVI